MMFSLIFLEIVPVLLGYYHLGRPQINSPCTISTCLGDKVASLLHGVAKTFNLDSICNRNRVSIACGTKGAR